MPPTAPSAPLKRSQCDEASPAAFSAGLASEASGSTAASAGEEKKTISKSPVKKRFNASLQASVDKILVNEMNFKKYIIIILDYSHARVAR